MNVFIAQKVTSHIGYWGVYQSEESAIAHITEYMRDLGREIDRVEPKTSVSPTHVFVTLPGIYFIIHESEVL